MRHTTKETLFLLAVSTILAVALTRAYAETPPYDTLILQAAAQMQTLTAAQLPRYR